MFTSAYLICSSVLFDLVFHLLSVACCMVAFSLKILRRMCRSHVCRPGGIWMEGNNERRNAHTKILRCFVYAPMSSSMWLPTRLFTWLLQLLPTPGWHPLSSSAPYNFFSARREPPFMLIDFFSYRQTYVFTWSLL